MDTALVLYTRDLRVHDLPALAAAREQADKLVCAFVLDETLLDGFGVPNRLRFLCDALGDLRERLRERGANLAVRRGDWHGEVMRLATEVGAQAVHMSEDYSSYARRRERRLERACDEHGIELHLHPGVMVVPPDLIRTNEGEHYKVFSPYARQWRQAPWRELATTPRSIDMLTTVNVGELPRPGDLGAGGTSPELPAGGETAGRELMHRWLRRHLDGYADRHDDLPADRTSRLSPYLHFGCVSPLELARKAGEQGGGEEFVRQLAWRDFHHQVLDAFGELPRREYRSRGDEWSRSERWLEAWKQGRTGYPIVDAGMRQLRREGWMHNRARLTVASFLTKDLYIDWRAGAAHFFDWLVDGDIANNAGNWQWTAGTGNDTRPNRMLNPLRQAERFDPDGTYVRRYVPELESIEGDAVHEPWKLNAATRSALDYPEPIVDHHEAREAFKRRRD